MKRFDIDHIAFIGRTYEEYISIFDLNEEIMKSGPILDCAAGPSSFTAEANMMGYDVTACDLVYDQGAFDLFKIGYRDIAYVFTKFDEVTDDYTWNYYRDKEHVISCRKLSLGRFVKDFRRNNKSRKYIRAELPKLPYPDNSVGLVLSSHFLFLYGDRMDLDFHFACLKEFLRVCTNEIRIYPLTGLDTRTYHDMDKLLLLLDKSDIKYEIVKVPFEFQRGSDRMMIIYKNKEVQS